jgi:hypothetical protein
MQKIFFSKNENQYNSYKFTYLTFEAENQMHRCKHNRQISYRPNKLHQFDQTSKIISYFIYYLLIYLHIFCRGTCVPNG